MGGGPGVRNFPTSLQGVASLLPGLFPDHSARGFTFPQMAIDLVFTFFHSTL